MAALIFGLISIELYPVCIILTALAAYRQNSDMLTVVAVLLAVLPTGFAVGGLIFTRLSREKNAGVLIHMAKVGKVLCLASLIIRALIFLLPLTGLPEAPI